MHSVIPDNLIVIVGTGTGEDVDESWILGKSTKCASFNAHFTTWDHTGITSSLATTDSSINCAL